MPYVRDHTWDINIWNDIVLNNEYAIHDPWPYNVIDIGGHIGSFSYKMLTQHNTNKIIVIEPNIDNYNLLIKNLEPFITDNRVIALNKGIGPSGTKISISGTLGVNTGGSFYTPSNEGIDTLLLDDIINMIDNNLPILLKLDCEGCEYEALASCTQLERINCIVGEFHIIDNHHNVEIIQKILKNYVFDYHFRSDHLGLFGAHKP